MKMVFSKYANSSSSLSSDLTHTHTHLNSPLGALQLDPLTFPRTGSFGVNVKNRIPSVWKDQQRSNKVLDKVSC